MHDDPQQPQQVADVNAADTVAVEAARTIEAQTEANKRTVTDAAATALDDLAAITAATDADVAASSGSHIKTLARVMRLILRLQLSRFEGTT